MDSETKDTVISGGFFQKGMRLKDYWDHLTDDETILVHEVFFLVLEHLDEYRDKRFTNRGWADLLAAIHAEVENKDYSYLDFYEA